ncbi:dihydroorotate dehydrogenase [Candidatus Woesearchaeota archaeon]|nr:dihydroorotate dehydrogenase [Candidatus Woesearchaeota archaeon]
MLNTTFLGTNFRNPLILASGILGINAEYFQTLETKGVGGITTKSFSLKERKGHKNPVMFNDDHGFLNAVGLSNGGIGEAIKLVKDAKKLNVPIIASIFAGTIEEFGEMAKQISEAKPDFIEANISCPNVKEEFGVSFSSNPESASKVTSAVKNNTNISVIIKLSPNVTDIKIIAKAVEEAGADAITAINTLAGMRINIDVKTPILSNRFGGVSGKGIFPVALKNVYDIYETVDIPIIGTGGITSGKDAIEMLMAGASLVGVGTGVYYRGPEIFNKIAKEMEEWMILNGYTNIKQVIGAAHK